MSSTIQNVPSDLPVVSTDAAFQLTVSPESVLQVSDEKIIAIAASGSQMAVSLQTETVKKTKTRRAMVRADITLAVPNPDGGIRKLPMSMHTVITVPRNTIESLPLPTIAEALEAGNKANTLVLGDTAAYVSALVN